MPFSAAILCGGRNSRMGGQNKGLLQLNQETFLQRLQRTLKPLVTEIILVTKDPSLYTGLDLKVTSDIYPVQSSLAGVHAALIQAVNPHVFITACDVPLLKTELVRYMLDVCAPDDEVVVPASNGYFEPLCAVYSCTCLTLIEALLNEKIFRISALFSKVRLKKIPYATLQQFDPDLESFLNVNCHEDLKRLKTKKR